jgi:hypothetical protein
MRYDQIANQGLMRACVRGRARYLDLVVEAKSRKTLAKSKRKMRHNLLQGRSSPGADKSFVQLIRNCRTRFDRQSLISKFKNLFLA